MIDLHPTRMNLLDPTSGRDTSHLCLINLWPKEWYTVVCVCVHVSKNKICTSTRMHYALLHVRPHGRSERGRWGFPLKPQKAHFHTCYSTPFLRPKAYKARVGGVSPLVGLSKFVRVGYRSILTHPKANNI